MPDCLAACLVNDMSPVLDLPFRAWTLNDLGMVQQLTGDYPAAAAASHQQALELFRDLGFRLVLISPAEMSRRRDFRSGIGSRCPLTMTSRGMCPCYSM